MCCSNILRIIMIVFNGIIFLAGAALLGIGIWVKVDSPSLVKVLGSTDELDQILSVAYLLIAVGAVLVVMGFLGCCGAIRKSSCMLLTFFVIVLLVFIAEVAGAVVLFVFTPLVEDIVNKLGTKTVQGIKAEYGKEEDFTEIWTTTMEKLKCCGFYNYTDFDGSPFNSNGNYPDTCCTTTPCTLEEVERQNVTGCFKQVVNLLESNIVIVGGVAIGIAALEIAAMVVSMILYRKSLYNLE